MKSPDLKVVILFFIKNFLSTVYVLPFWFLGVFIFENLWIDNGALPKDWIILMLNIAGCLFFALLLVGCYYWAWFSMSRFSYELGQDGLHIRSGIILRRHVLVPYNTIGAVAILLNPIVARFLGLYSLQIMTREVSNTEGVLQKEKKLIISGLSQEAVKSLRTELLSYSHIQAVKKTFFDPVSGQYH